MKGKSSESFDLQKLNNDVIISSRISDLSFLKNGVTSLFYLKQLINKHNQLHIQ